MVSPIVDQFMEALQQLEEQKTLEPMLPLFYDDCEVCNLSVPGLRGKEGLEKFWRDYLALFDEVKTRFIRVTEAGDKAFLEWASEARFHSSGKPLHYEGLTILEFEDGKVKRLKAYHDTAAFTREGSKHSLQAGLSTERVMGGGPNRDRSTPGEGVLTSSLTDRDAATG